MKYLFLILLVSMNCFADDFDKYTEKQNKPNDECGRSWFNPNHGNKCDENYHGGGWVNSVEKEDLSEIGERCLKETEFFYSKYKKVIICFPDRYVDKNTYNPDLPPLTGEPPSTKIKRAVNKICAANKKGEVEEKDIERIYGQDIMQVRCGLTKDELKVIESKQKAKALELQKKEKEQSKKAMKKKLEPIKKQCIDLGFKENTEDFRNCMIELI